MAYRCSGCGQDIVWIQTAAGKRMPCDPPRVTIVTDDGKTVTGRTPHWATCPHAERFKREQ